MRHPPSVEVGSGDLDWAIWAGSGAIWVADLPKPNTVGHQGLGFMTRSGLIWATA